MKYRKTVSLRKTTKNKNRLLIKKGLNRMKIHDFLIHNHNEEAFHIDADESLYWLIANDMLENAGDLAPRLVWQKIYDSADYSTYNADSDRYKEMELSSREMQESAKAVLEKYPNLEDLLGAWVGPRAARTTLDEDLLKKYRSYLSSFDNCRFFDTLYNHDGYKMMSGFLTVEEISILNIELSHLNHASFLEIGGGYGRLAEALMNVYDDQIHYIMADSVPISLMYCYLYLKKNLPSKKIGIYYLDKINPELYDVFIIPTWRLEEVCGNRKFDVLINIQSFQEMTQFHVDYYMNFFDKHSKQNSIIYLNNNKKYIFLGDWNYPKEWKLHFRHNSPWAWSDDCPVEVFSKGNIDYSRKNLLVNSLYLKDIENTALIKENELKLESLYKAQSQNETQINLTQGELQKTQGELQKTQHELYISTEKNTQYELTISQLMSSISWKITRPLRWVRRMMNYFKK